MSLEQLAGGVITDEGNRVLLLHRTDHNQWQLPGGRLRTDDDNGLVIENPQETVIREVQAELGLETSYKYLRKIGETVFRQGIVDYSCEWFRVQKFSGTPYLHEPETYDDWDYFNLYKYGISRVGLSPNVENLKTRLQNSAIRL